MDKLKDIFSPGHKQDADVLYGSQQSASPSTTGQLSGEGSHFDKAKNTTHSHPQADTVSGIPSTVDTTKSHNRHDTLESATNTTASNPASGKDTGLAREALNPHGDKHDETRYGTKEPVAGTTTTLPDRTAGTVEPTPTRASQGGALEPVGGVSHSSDRGQGIVGAGSGTGNLRPSEYADQDDVTVASVRSGVIGDTPHAKKLTDSDIPAGPDTTSHSGIGAGPAAAAAGAGTAAVLGSSNDRSFPLSGGSHSNPTGTRDDLTTRNEPSTLGGTAGAARNEPSVLGSTTGTTGTTTGTTTGSHGARDDHKGLATAAAATAFASHEHGGRGHKYEGPNTDTKTPGPDFTSGPHATGTANRIDPNISSGQTSSTHGTSTHGSSTLGSSNLGHSEPETSIPSPLGGAGATHARTTYDDQRATAPDTARSNMPGAYPDSAAATPAHEEPGHHYGRDAALVGAGAAAAGGAYEARRKGSTETDPATFTHGPHKSNIANIVDPRVLPDPSKMKGHQAQSTATDPASKAGGPHSGDVANVADQRVLSQPEQTKQHTTAGAHQPDALSRADPQVDSDLSKDTSQHHYGRDAALAGGLSAGAAGAYAASQREGESNPYTSHAVDPRVHGSSTASNAPARSASTKGGWFAGPSGSAVDSSKNAPSQSTRSAAPTGLNDANTTQPTQQHHYGRDAAVAGGVGLAGAGAAHEYKQHHGDQTGRQYPSDANAPVTSSTTHPTASTTSTSQPMTSSTSTAQPTSQHNYGRDAALAGGAGLAGAGAAHEYRKHESDRAAHEHPSSTATGPTSSVSQPFSSTTSSSQPATSTTQPSDSHHYGRDAAVTGGAGLAGAGLAHQHRQHEADRDVQKYPSGTTVTTGPTSSTTHPISSTTASQPSTSTESQDNKHHYGRDAAIVGGAGLAGAGVAHEYKDHQADKAARDYPSGTASSSVPATSSTSQPTSSTTSAHPTSEHHYGRDAAVAGGAGLVGTGAAYEYQKREAEKAAREHPYGTTSSATGPISSHSKSTDDPSRGTSSEYSDDKHHYGRDAAAAGAVGAAGAGAMHEYSKHAAEKTEKENLKEEKKHQKELEKEEKKEEKKHQKEIEKEEKKQQKELEKEQKKHEKEIEKEEKKHEKELEKEEKKKHGGGLLGFLHRDKDKDEEKTTEPATTSDKHHRKEEAAGAAAVAGAGAAAYEHEHDKSGRNKLHKDPPPEYVRAHGGEHYGTDGRIGEAGAVSGLEQSGHGQHGAANSGDQGGIVIEPHTGLPMNVGKYGSGAGGTDGNETIPGMHSHGAGTDASGANVASQGNVQGSNTGTDWEGIKKANTPY